MRRENEGLAMYAEKVLTKEFSDEDSKKAYLKACKWIAKTIVSQAELRNAMFKIEKTQGAQLPTFKVLIFASTDEKEMREEHCTVCKAFHESFFMREKCDCEKCSLNAYHRRADRLLAHRKAFIKDRIEEE